MGVCLWNLALYIIWGYAYGRFWLLYKNNAQKCTEKWAYLKNGLSYSLMAWRGCYYQQSPPIATFTYAKGWKEKFKHVNIFKSTVQCITQFITAHMYYIHTITYVLQEPPGKSY